MPLSENHFKKFLVDEITRKSNASIKQALLEVNEFAKTMKFKSSYVEWKRLNCMKEKFYKGPKHIKMILSYFIRGI
jgi:hypothetical protein